MVSPRKWEAPRRVLAGPARRRPREYLARARDHGEERMVAAHARVGEAAAALLGEAVGLAYGGVDINGEGCVSRSGPGTPGAGKHKTGDSVQLAGVTEGERAQVGAEGGRGPHLLREYGRSRARAQKSGIIYTVAPGQGGVD